MTVNLLFLASLADTLGQREASIENGDSPMTVAGAIDHLAVLHGADWAEVLGSENVLTAVNQDLVSRSHVLNDGDELAFLPPVTGG